MADSMLERRIDLKGALPSFMMQFREMAALISSEDPEFDMLKQSLQGILDDMFVETASEAAISRYEKIMGIRPSAGDTLKTRRLRVLLAEGRVERFTIPKLIETAARLGEEVEAELTEGHRIALEFIAADPENIRILYEEFRRSLPAHLEIITRNVTELTGGAHMGGALGMSMNYRFTGE